MSKLNQSAEIFFDGDLVIFIKWETLKNDSVKILVNKEWITVSVSELYNRRYTSEHLDLINKCMENLAYLHKEEVLSFECLVETTKQLNDKYAEIYSQLNNEK